MIMSPTKILPLYAKRCIARWCDFQIALTKQKGLSNTFWTAPSVWLDLNFNSLQFIHHHLIGWIFHHIHINDVFGILEEFATV